MKTLKLGKIAFLAISLSACTQKSNVPNENLNKTFLKKFPNAQSVKWNQEENGTEWEVEFKINGKEYSANFSSDGSWKETEYKIENSEIPANVRQVLDSAFAGFKIEDAEICETTEGKVYEFDIEKDNTEMEVVISPDGSIVKKEVKMEEDEENNDENVNENDENDEDNED